VQAKIKREEAEALELMKKHHGSKAGLEGRHDVDGTCIVSLLVNLFQHTNIVIEDHSFYFWEKVLTAEDRRDLMSYGIRSCKPVVFCSFIQLTSYQWTNFMPPMKPRRRP
jgi:hypothetical protein